MKYAVENDAKEFSLHDGILKDLPVAKWLHSGSLLHNRWEIGTEDPTKRRNSTAIINFDTPVLPGLSLCDPECEGDLITAKVITYYSLSSSEGMFTTVQGAAIFTRSYIQFVRWRLSRGIRSNSALTREWIEECFETIRDRGIRGLIPIEERAETYAQAIRDGQNEAPTFVKGKRARFDFDAASRALGVPNGRSLTSEAQSIIVQLAEVVSHSVV